MVQRIVSGLRSRMTSRKLKNLAVPFRIVSSASNEITRVGCIPSDYVRRHEELEKFKHQLTAPLMFAQSHEAWNDETPSVLTHNVFLTFGYILSIVTSSKDLSILDVGGGLGQYFELAKALRPDIQLKYSVKELPDVAEAGRTQTPEVRFFSDWNQAEVVDLVIISGTLQYIPNWKIDIEKACATAANFLFVARLSLCLLDDDLMIEQSAKYYGLEEDHYFHAISRKVFLSVVTRLGFTLDREFLAEPDIMIEGKTVQWRSFLFRRR